MEVTHGAVDMAQPGLLLKYIAHRRNLVLQGHCPHKQRGVFKHNRLFGPYDVELHIYRQTTVEIIKHRAQYLPPVLKRVDGDVALQTGEGHGAYEAGKTEHMVAVHMRQEYMVEPRKLEALPLQLLLRPLAAIHHKEIVAEIDHSTRWIVHGRRLCASATQYVYFKFLQFC